MALSTIHTALMVKKTVEGTLKYVQLCCIKDYPDLGGAPTALETTTLCDTMQTFIEGVKSNDQLEFTANYTKDDYEDIVDLVGTEQQVAIYFGQDSSGDPDGHDGIFEFKAMLNVRVSGKGVDEVREMVITATPTTEISFS